AHPPGRRLRRRFGRARAHPPLDRGRYRAGEGHAVPARPIAYFEDIPEAVGASKQSRSARLAACRVRPRCRCGAAAARQSEARGEPTGGVSIRASVPVNLRPLDEAHKLGNSFGLVFLTLPVGTVDPVKRLRSIKKEMDELKRSPEALVAYAVLNLMGFAPVEVERLGLAFFGRKVTAI